ncbi:DUF6635 family protein [Phaeovulum veldkampii]|nr:DUF6635 family protein [Phaeovulum veldkampii]TDQ57736.1 hypothetical protein EV658_1112 [Phaeovulum veldkampii DSM 11550]
MQAAYFSDRRSRVDGFVQRHFSVPGTLRLHAVAFGRDILRAPVNVALAPVLVLIRVLAWLCRRVGLARLSAWLARRRILLRTEVARRIETLIVTDLLEVPLPEGATAGDPLALSRAVLSAPQFRDVIRQRESVVEAQALAGRIAVTLADYSGTRSAVAEMTTALVTLIAGAVAFQALTPGMISLAPDLADAVSRTAAIADFPLGKTLGGLWYGVFPTGASALALAATVIGLVMTGAVVAAFAGVIADPVQSRLGIHHRRLMRLIDTLQAELDGAAPKPFTAPEHYFARALDLWDAALSALRALRS